MFIFWKGVESFFGMSCQKSLPIKVQQAFKNLLELVVSTCTSGQMKSSIICCVKELINNANEEFFLNGIITNRKTHLGETNTSMGSCLSVQKCSTFAVQMFSVQEDHLRGMMASLSVRPATKAILLSQKKERANGTFLSSCEIDFSFPP